MRPVKLQPMTVLVLASAFIAPPVMAAGNASATPSWCDGAECVPDVPHSAAPGAPCQSGTRWDFGIDPSSNKTFVCAMTGQWVETKPLIGVRPEGAPCSGNPGAAQSPDGIPLICDGQGWRQDYTDIFFKKTT